MNLDRFQPPTAAEQNQREQCSVCGCEPDFLIVRGDELFCRECFDNINQETENE